VSLLHGKDMSVSHLLPEWSIGSAGAHIKYLLCVQQTKERDEVMEDFRKNRTNVLITTNVLARGVDVSHVCAVDYLFASLCEV